MYQRNNQNRNDKIEFNKNEYTTYQNMWLTNRAGTTEYPH